jgi:ATP-dependent helicase/nuclease subunit B
MMVARFLLGRAGSGKTYRCLLEVTAEQERDPSGPPLLFLVPEQATYQMSRSLLSGLPGRASARAQVVSFSRLATQLIGEVGGLDRRRLDDLGRQMLIRSLLLGRERDLKLYRGASIKPGLVANLARLLHELRQYCVEPEQLGRGIEALRADSALARKLHDLHLLYSDYLKRCRSDVFDSDDVPRALAHAIGKSRWLDGARLWVDSFSDFTAQEFDLLQALFRRIKQPTIALSLDPGDLPPVDPSVDPARLFHRTEATYRQLCRLLPAGAEVQVVSLPDRNTPSRFTAPELAHLEACLFPAAEPYPLGAPQAVTLVEAADRRAEVDACARRILQLVREHDYRFRDVAVIVRDLQGYHDLVESSFDDYGIPYFIDQRRSMAHHPLVELIRCALRAVAEGWRYEHVLPYLRTGFPPVDASVVDRIDNHAVEHGIEGKAWYEDADWPFRASAAHAADRDVRRLNEQRKEAVAALRIFQEKLRPAARSEVRHVAVAIYGMLQELKAKETLESWRCEAERNGQLDLASEHVQAWDATIGLLDELVLTLGDEKFTLAEFTEVLEEGLASLALGLVPPAVDEVLVGSIERSRQPEIKAAFILGLNERQFPLVSGEDPILSDADRASLSECRIELGPTSEDRFHQETYLGYVAFTRASERLWASCTRAADKGKRLNPSSLFDRLRSVFPELTPLRIGARHQPCDLDAVLRPADLAGGLVHRLRLPDSKADLQQWLTLYDRTREFEPVKAVLKGVLPALAYDNSAHLQPDRALTLFGDPLEGTVSRLESFAQCPFRHFVRYGLRLEPRSPFRLDVMDLGNYYHAVLKHFVNRTQGRKWRDLTPDEAEHLVDEGIDREAPLLRNEILLSTARNRYVLEQCRRSMRLFVRSLLVQSRFTRFEPMHAEVAFGDDDGPVPAFELPLPSDRNLKLRGRIDRVDVATVNGQTLVRVVDYKSGGKTLRLDEVFHGLSLQLLAYLLAVTEGAGAALQLNEPVAAAAFYSRLLCTPKRTDGPEQNDEPTGETFLKEFKMRGVFRSDVIGSLDTSKLQGWSRFLQVYIANSGKVGHQDKSEAVEPAMMQRLLNMVRQHLIRLAQEIMQGRIDAAPIELRGQRPCRQCDFQAVCRFEAPYNQPRVLKTMKNSEVLSLL